MEKQTIELNGTTLNVQEENGIVTIHINSKDAVVYMNNELMWSIGNEKEEYKRIPRTYHDYLIKHSYSMEVDQKGQKTIADVANGEDIMFLFPFNRKLDVHARFGFITSVEEVRMYLEERDIEGEAEVIAEKFNHLKKFIEDKGYQFIYSHAADDWAWGWWDVVVDPGEWNESIFSKIIKEISRFKKNLYDMMEKYNL
jgi:hypothetical protein